MVVAMVVTMVVVIVVTMVVTMVVARVVVSLGMTDKGRASRKISIIRIKYRDVWICITECHLRSPVLYEMARLPKHDAPGFRGDACNFVWRRACH
jgi:hypothetical protein